MQLATLFRSVSLAGVFRGFRRSRKVSQYAEIAERDDAPREVCELALAHADKDRVEAAYRRIDLLEKRRALMDDWANYLAGAGSGFHHGGGVGPHEDESAETK